MAADYRTLLVAGGLAAVMLAPAVYERPTARAGPGAPAAADVTQSAEAANGAQDDAWLQPFCEHFGLADADAKAKGHATLSLTGGDLKFSGSARLNEDGPDCTLTDLKIELKRESIKKSHAWHFVIATVADPLSPDLDVFYDHDIEGIVAGATAAGWKFERMWLPWKTPRDKSTTAAGAVQQPGVMLFRTALPRPNKEKELVIWLVDESPAAGIDRARFRTAAQTTRIIFGGTFQLLSPSFSGSVSSLTDELRVDDPEGPSEIVSATANVPRSIATLNEDAMLRGKVRIIDNFDEDMRKALLDYLYCKIRDHGAVALISESDTAFNGDPPSNTRASRNGGAARDSETDASPRDPCVLPKDALCRYHFPRGIADLRNEIEADTPALQDSGPYLPLTLRSATTAPRPGDVTSFAPQTLDSTQGILNSIAKELRDRNVQYALVSATSIEDQIFVATELRRLAPDPVYILGDADNLLIQAAVERNAAGMLALGTAFPDRELGNGPVFSSSQSEHVYDAMLALLDQDNSGAAKPYRGYEAKAAKTGSPPLPPIELAWIEPSGFQQIATLAPAARNLDGLVYAPSVASDPRTTSFPWLLFFLCLLLAGTLALSLAHLHKEDTGIDRLDRPEWVVSFFSRVVAIACVCTVWYAWLAFAVLVVGALVCIGVMRDGSGLRRSSPWLATFLAALTAAFVAWYLASQSDHRLFHFHERMQALFGGASPLLPVLLLLAGFAFWASCLRRAWRVREAMWLQRCVRELEPQLRRAMEGLVDLKAGPWPAWSAFSAIAAVCAGAGIDYWRGHGPLALEPRSFTVAILLLAVPLAGAVAYSAANFWRRGRAFHQFLDAMRAEPDIFEELEKLDGYDIHMSIWPLSTTEAVRRTLSDLSRAEGGERLERFMNEGLTLARWPEMRSAMDQTAADAAGRGHWRYLALYLTLAVQGGAMECERLLQASLFGGFVLLCAAFSYPFLPHYLVVNFFSLGLILLLGVVLWQVFGVHGHRVLLRIRNDAAHPDAKRNGEFIVHVLGYAGLPVFSLLAAHFPEMRHLLFSIVQPVFRYIH